MPQDFRLGLCVPRAPDFSNISVQMKTAAEVATEYCNRIYGSQLNVRMEIVEEPCESYEAWGANPSDCDVIIGPTCSRHAWDLLENQPFPWKAAISPGADLPSLSYLRKDRPFFRVCGDGSKFAREFSMLLPRVIQFQWPVLMYDQTNRWWSETTTVLSRDLRRRWGLNPIMIGFRPNSIGNELRDLGPGRVHSQTDLVIYLGDPFPDLENITQLLLSVEHRHLVFPRPFEVAMNRLLAATSLSADNRVFVMSFRAPEISSRGQSHLRRLRERLGGEGSGYAAHVHDAVLTAVEAFHCLLEEGRPLGGYSHVLEGITVEGCSGTIEFDSGGNRKNQGSWDLKVWKNSRFGRVTQEGIGTVYDRMNLHPTIRQVSESLFKDEHYDQAIFEAFKRVEVEVRGVSGITDTGVTLMHRAFNKDAPVIKLNELTTDLDKDEQEGFRFMFAGSTSGIRNLGAHEFPKTDPSQALEYLALASLLMRRLDRRLSPP